MRLIRMRGDAGEHVECRFGLAGRLPVEIEWLSDSGSPYTARDTRALARGIGVVPCTTPFESPHRTAWRKPSSKPSKRLRQGQRCRMRSACCASSTVHPHKALGYRSPREFRERTVEKTTANAVGAVRRP